MDIKKLEKPDFDLEIDNDIKIGLESRVILFNDDWHSFEEVITQLIKATKCTFEQARDHTFEVHVKGQSIVFTGHMSKCLKVSSVLEEIALLTQIIT
jgi:ATP-dependent Clp protease adaptor protein ClpS.